MTGSQKISRYLIWRDGARWQFYVEDQRGDRTGWRFTERGAKRAARRLLHRRHAPRRGRPAHA